MRLTAVLTLFLATLLTAAENRVVRQVNYTRSVTLKGHINPRLQPGDDRGPVDADMPIRNGALILQPGRGISSFLTELPISTSPNYRKWLTPEQFGDRFGLSADDLAKVAAWLESEGMKVGRIARGRNWIQFSGTAAQAARTFRTQLRRYSLNGQMHFAPSTEPSIPEAFEEVVAGIRG